jgi:hypothetical protein
MATPLLFVPQMNWKSPFRETHSYLTEIRPGADGTEQRSGKRLIPTVRWEYPVTTLDGLATQTVDAILYGGQGALLAAPFWPHVTRLTAAASAGSAVVLACDTTDRDFQTTGLGAFALLIHGTGATQTVEYVATTAKTGSSLTVATLTQSFPIGTLVFPARVGYPNEAVTLGRPSNRTGDLQFAFDVKVVTTYGTDAPFPGQTDPDPVPVNPDTGRPETSVGALAPAKAIVTISAEAVGVVTTIIVQARDQAGNQLTTGGATVAGSVSGANTATLTFTDGSNGRYTATYTPTTAGTNAIAITVNSTAVAGSPFASAVAASAPTPGTGDLEPDGATAITTRHFAALDEDGWSALSTDADAAIVTTGYSGTPPVSSGSVLRVRYQAGYPGGGTPIATSKTIGASYRRLYFRQAVQVSAGWLGHSSGVLKTLILNIDDKPKAVLALQGSGSNTLRAQWRLQDLPAQSLLGSGNALNLTNYLSASAAVVPRATWVTLEGLLVCNTGDQENGEAWLAVDGVLVTRVRNLKWSTAAGGKRWQSVKLQPYYGGNGGTVPQLQYLYVDDLYMSGKA